MAPPHPFEPGPPTPAVELGCIGAAVAQGQLPTTHNQGAVKRPATASGFPLAMGQGGLERAQDPQERTCALVQISRSCLRRLTPSSWFKG